MLDHWSSPPSYEDLAGTHHVLSIHTLALIPCLLTVDLGLLSFQSYLGHALQ